jgi:hypothetical protein
MNDGSISSPNWALRVEAEASRRLARRLSDTQSVKDLKSYASELEAEAARLQVDQNPSSNTACNSVKSIAAPGRAARTQPMPTNRGAR